MTRRPVASPPLTVRSYRPGDESRLVEIWNHAYGRYAGPVPRTVSHWRWSILGRPDVAHADVVVLTASSDIAGFGVVGDRGMILEFAVDGALAPEARVAAAESLIDALEARCRERGHDSIVFGQPSDDVALARVLRARGYRGESSQAFQLVFVDLRHWLEQVLRHRQAALAPLTGHAVHLRLERGSYRFLPHPDLTIHIASPPTVTTEPAARATATEIATDAGTLTDVLLGRTAVEAMLATGRIRMRPDDAESPGRRLLAALVTPGPWYTSKADGR